MENLQKFTQYVINSISKQHVQEEQETKKLVGLTDRKLEQINHNTTNLLIPVRNRIFREVSNEHYQFKKEVISDMKAKKISREAEKAMNFKIKLNI